MTDYISQYTSPRFPYEKQEADRLVAKFETDATVTDGVVRWNSNKSVPPQDILDFWKFLGKPFDYAKSSKVREDETSQFLQDYRKAQKGRRRSREEMFELRANFGRGAKVVDVITGKVTKL